MSWTFAKCKAFNQKVKGEHFRSFGKTSRQKGFHLIELISGATDQ